MNFSFAHAEGYTSFNMKPCIIIEVLVFVNFIEYSWEYVQAVSGRGKCMLC